MAEKKFFSFLNKFKWFEKLKKIKHFEIILVVILACLVLLIWFADFGDDKTTSSNSNKTYSSSSLSQYTQELESRLESVLGNIDGAGKVNVMITFDGNSEVILATTTDEKVTSNSTTSSGGTVNESKTETVSVEPVLITGNGTTTPIIIMEKMPNIKGVIVIAEGANDVRVKLDLLKAVQALLTVTSSQVEIFKGN